MLCACTYRHGYDSFLKWPNTTNGTFHCTNGGTCMRPGSSLTTQLSICIPSYLSSLTIFVLTNADRREATHGLPMQNVRKRIKVIRGTYHSSATSLIYTLYDVLQHAYLPIL